MDEMCTELNGVWERIGGCILEALETQQKVPLVPRADVAELVLDHMRVDMGVSKRTIEYFDNIKDLEKKIKQVEACFPFDTYGW